MRVLLPNGCSMTEVVEGMATVCCTHLLYAELPTKLTTDLGVQLSQPALV